MPNFSVPRETDVLPNHTQEGKGWASYKAKSTVDNLVYDKVLHYMVQSVVHTHDRPVQVICVS